MVPNKQIVVFTFQFVVVSIDIRNIIDEKLATIQLRTDLNVSRNSNTCEINAVIRIQDVRIKPWHRGRSTHRAFIQKITEFPLIFLFFISNSNVHLYFDVIGL